MGKREKEGNSISITTFKTMMIYLSNLKQSHLNSFLLPFAFLLNLADKRKVSQI
jgi:hypothetical protein